MQTRTREVNVEGHIVTQKEANIYKNKLMTEYNLPKEMAERYTNSYIKDRTTEPYEKVIPGKDFMSSFLFSSFIYLIAYGILFIIFHTKNAYYNELFGTNKNDALSGWRRFFRWNFYMYVNKLRGE